MTVTGDPASPPASSDGVDVRPEPEAASVVAERDLPVPRGRRRHLAERATRSATSAAAPSTRRCSSRATSNGTCASSPRTPGCATYRAAPRERAPTTVARIPVPATTTPTCGRRRDRSCSSSRPSAACLGLSGSPVRAGGQVALVALMIVAFVVLIVARTSPSGPGGGPDASLAAGASASASRPRRRPRRHARPRRRAHPLAASAEPRADGEAQAHAEADDGTGHAPLHGQVRRHARRRSPLRFGTTLKVLKRLNNITDPRLIHTGQVLVLP